MRTWSIQAYCEEERIVARSVVRLDSDKDGERGPNRTTTGLLMPGIGDDMADKMIFR